MQETPRAGNNHVPQSWYFFIRVTSDDDDNHWAVTMATVPAVAKLTYSCSAWWGYLDSSGWARIQSVLNKFRRLGFLMEDISFVQICKSWK